MKPLSAKRILIYGVTGSGKTTLAAQVSEAIGIEWHSVDELTFEANWKPVPDESQRRIIAEICDQPEWILDTAYGKWLDIPLKRVELIIALDYPRWLSLKRLVFRTIRRMIDQQPICNGNKESLSLTFSKNSIILWHFKAFKRKRMRIHQWLNQPEGPQVIRFTHPKETESWLQKISTQRNMPTSEVRSL